MRVNELKSKMGSGEVVIGSFLYIPSAKLSEIIGIIGFDFVVIDMEHGPIDMVVAEDMIRGAELGGAAAIVRVTHNSPHLVLDALDAGAVGVHVPEITTASDASRAAMSTKYGPVGFRGLAGVRAAEYGLNGPLSEYPAAANKETMVVAHVESEAAVKNLDELLDVEGIDVYYLGPEDISNSLGIPGRSKDERVVALVEGGIRKIVSRGKIAGTIAADHEDARRYVDLGADISQRIASGTWPTGLGSSWRT